MSIPTTERLARALEEQGDPRLEDMIKKAREGYYDDFRSPLNFPSLALAADLDLLGFHSLAKRAASGEWDSTPEESEAWEASLKPEEIEKAKKDLIGLLGHDPYDPAIPPEVTLQKLIEIDREIFAEVFPVARTARRTQKAKRGHRKSGFADRQLIS